jgi:hypothetical protein
MIVVGGRTFDSEPDALGRKEGESVIQYEHLPGRPTLEAKSTGELAEGGSLEFSARKADSDHGCKWQSFFRR